METLVHFKVGPTPVVARVAPDTPAEPGMPLHLQADMDQMHIIEPDSGRVV